uniref:Leucine-rich repeat-containing protein 32 n=1 Tax=Anas platyrhynchos TaxID=8839 RepID=A0A8B9SHP2_ANAPL
MLQLGARLTGARCLLLCLLLAILGAQPGWAGRPKPLPCQQSPTKLSCKGAGLHRFPEELGQGVKYLELSNNFIRNLSESHMSGFGQLEHLDLRSNQLEAVSGAALAQLPRLRSLLLGSNRLDRNYLANGPAFGLLGNIEVLDLSANNLESHMAGWYLSSLPTLKKLDLSGNRMTRLPAGIFWSTPQLSELNLSNNYIMEIEEGAFGALEELEVVNLAFNSLHCISGFSLRQLRVLNLSHNALELFVSEEGEEPYLLQVLDLSHNRLLYFPELPRAHYLTHLNLSNNLIASLAPSSGLPAALTLHYDEMGRFNGSSGTAAGLTRVANLDLSNNQLQLFPFAFFRGLSSLHNLSVAMNCLQDVTRETLTGGTAGDSVATLQGNVSLSVRSLDLHDNLLRALPPWFFDFLPQLETIDLGSNSLQPCESRGGDRGGTLGGDPRGAGPCTAFSNVPQLKHLSLSRNNITLLQPYAFNQTSLLSLDLSENGGLALPRTALGGLELSLQELWLRGNQMGDGSAELPCLGALKSLDLSGNRFSLLPAGLLCSPLESLDVRDNNLPALAELAVASWARSLRVLWVAGNPFSCCGLGWLDVLRAARVRLPDLDRALCAYGHRRGNFSAPLSSHPWGPCPRPKGALVALLVVLSILLCLGYGACCLLRKGQKPPGCGVARGSNGGGFVPHPRTGQAAKERPADGDTKV